MKKIKKNKDSTKELSLKTSIALVIIVFLIGVGSTMIGYTLYKTVFVTEFNIQFEMTGPHHLGFNADPNLHFGKVPVNGASSKKYMNLYNSYDFPIYVDISIEGNASDFVYLEDNGFILDPEEFRKLTIQVSTEKDFPKANYTGKAIVVYRRV